uniref:hypothetical protein n=1 Tax=Flavobacterium sp. TaxID=239 RepID=UPI002628F92D
YKEEMIYDDFGNIIKDILYSKYDGIIHKEINKYKYDDFNNIIEINRSNGPKERYPIIMTGGPELYEIEKYRYIYNKDGLWIKKYRIAGGKKILTCIREFKE